MEARLETFGHCCIPEKQGEWSELKDWWLLHKKGANTPNWGASLWVVRSRIGPGWSW